MGHCRAGGMKRQCGLESQSQPKAAALRDGAFTAFLLCLPGSICAERLLVDQTCFLSHPCQSTFRGQPARGPSNLKASYLSDYTSHPSPLLTGSFPFPKHPNSFPLWLETQRECQDQLIPVPAQVSFPRESISGHPTQSRPTAPPPIATVNPITLF